LRVGRWAPLGFLVCVFQLLVLLAGVSRSIPRSLIR
jgi:hypothetical protein